MMVAAYTILHAYAELYMQWQICHERVAINAVLKGAIMSCKICHVQTPDSPHDLLFLPTQCILKMPYEPLHSYCCKQGLQVFGFDMLVLTRRF